MQKKPSHCSEELTNFIFLRLLTFYQKFGKDKHIAIELKVNIMSCRSKILLLDLIHILFILFMQKTTGAWNYKIICKELGKPESLITHVADRKGHDMRYAIDPTKIHNELGWLPETKFEDGIKKTIKWYLENKEWWETIISGEYQNYYEKMYAHREEI